MLHLIIVNSYKHIAHHNNFMVGTILIAINILCFCARSRIPVLAYLCLSAMARRAARHVYRTFGCETYCAQVTGIGGNQFSQTQYLRQPGQHSLGCSLHYQSEILLASGNALGPGSNAHSKMSHRTTVTLPSLPYANQTHSLALLCVKRILNNTFSRLVSMPATFAQAIPANKVNNTAQAGIRT